MRALRQQVRDRSPLWGAFAGANSPLVAEQLARSGFDWICVDTQHAPSSGSAGLSAMIQAIDGADVPALVRVPWKTDFGSIMTALDAGAHGVIVPMLDTAQEAEAVARACRYPPAGFRSFGPWRSGMRHREYSTKIGDEHALCLVQIETAAGMENLDAIIAVDGVDGAYIGPQDLSLSNGGGLSWRTDNELLHRMAEQILGACLQAGKIAVAHTADPGDAVHWGAMGFHMVTVTSDTRLIEVGARSALDTVSKALTGELT